MEAFVKYMNAVSHSRSVFHFKRLKDAMVMFRYDGGVLCQSIVELSKN
jgi:hypothetical protein